MQDVGLENRFDSQARKSLRMDNLSNGSERDLLLLGARSVEGGKAIADVFEGERPAQVAIQNKAMPGSAPRQ